MKSTTAVSNPQCEDSVLEFLNNFLCDEYGLYLRTWTYSLSIAGSPLDDLHRVYGEHCDELNRIIYEIITRIRSLGGDVAGTLSKVLRHTLLREYMSPRRAAKKTTADLLAGHSTIIEYLKLTLRNCTDENQDKDTHDLITGWLEKHQDISTVLKAILTHKLHLHREW